MAKKVKQSAFSKAADKRYGELKVDSYEERMAPYTEAKKSMARTEAAKKESAAKVQTPVFTSSKSSDENKDKPNLFEQLMVVGGFAKNPSSADSTTQRKPGGEVAAHERLASQKNESDTASSNPRSRSGSNVSANPRSQSNKKANSEAGQRRAPGGEVAAHNRTEKQIADWNKKTQRVADKAKAKDERKAIMDANREVSGKVLGTVAGAQQISKHAIDYAADKFTTNIGAAIEGIGNAVKNTVPNKKTREYRANNAKKMTDYMNANPSAREGLKYNDDAAIEAAMKATGMTRDAVEDYIRSNDDRWAAEDIDSNTEYASVSPAYKKTVGTASAQLGNMYPGMLTGALLPGVGASGSGGVIGNIISAAKNGGNVLKAAASSVGNALIGNPTTWLISASSAGSRMNELQNERGYDKMNVAKGVANGFSEGFTEGLFGLSDAASIERLGASRGTELLLNYALEGAEEGLEEVVNVPLQRGLEKALGEDYKWVGKGGVFDLEEMARNGLAGAAMGWLMGGFGAVNGVFDNRSLTQQAQEINRASEKYMPEAQPLDVNRATQEEIADRAAAVVERIADIKDIMEENAASDNANNVPDKQRIANATEQAQKRSVRDLANPAFVQELLNEGREIRRARAEADRQANNASLDATMPAYSHAPRAQETAPVAETLENPAETILPQNPTNDTNPLLNQLMVNSEPLQTEQEQSNPVAEQNPVVLDANQQVYHDFAIREGFTEEQAMQVALSEDPDAEINSLMTGRETATDTNVGIKTRNVDYEINLPVEEMEIPQEIVEKYGLSEEQAEKWKIVSTAKQNKMLNLYEQNGFDWQDVEEMSQDPMFLATEYPNLTEYAETEIGPYISVSENGEIDYRGLVKKLVDEGASYTEAEQIAFSNNTYRIWSFEQQLRDRKLITDAVGKYVQQNDRPISIDLIAGSVYDATGRNTNETLRVLFGSELGRQISDRYDGGADVELPYAYRIAYDLYRMGCDLSNIELGNFVDAASDFIEKTGDVNEAEKAMFDKLYQTADRFGTVQTEREEVADRGVEPTNPDLMVKEQIVPDIQQAQTEQIAEQAQEQETPTFEQEQEAIAQEAENDTLEQGTAKGLVDTLAYHKWGKSDITPFEALWMTPRRILQKMFGDDNAVNDVMDALRSRGTFGLDLKGMRKSAQQAARMDKTNAAFETGFADRNIYSETSTDDLVKAQEYNSLLDELSVPQSDTNGTVRENIRKGRARHETPVADATQTTGKRTNIDGTPAPESWSTDMYTAYNYSIDALRRIYDLGLTETESALVERIGEGQEVDASETKGADMAKVEAAIPVFREIYDHLHDTVNGFLAVRGHEPMAKLENYFTHMAEPSMFGIANPIENKGRIPGFTNRRVLEENPNHTPNAVRGMEIYLQSTMNFVANYDVVNRLYDLRKSIEASAVHIDLETGEIKRGKGNGRNSITIERELPLTAEGIMVEDGGGGSAEQQRYIHAVQAIVNDPAMTTAEKENAIANMNAARISKKYPVFWNWMNDYMNLMSGKPMSIDVSEQTQNRGWYKALKKIDSNIAQSQIVGNISTAVSNFVATSELFGTRSAKAIAKSAYKTLIANVVPGHNDHIETVSRVLYNRMHDSWEEKGNFYDKTKQKEKRGLNLNILMDISDKLTTELAFRAAYEDAIDMGMVHTEAVRYADNFTADVIGERTKGTKPLAYESENVVRKILSRYTLEANEQRQFFADRFKNGFGEGMKAVLGAAIATRVFNYFIREKVFGLTSSLGFDPIEWISELIEMFTQEGRDEEEQTAAQYGAVQGLNVGMDVLDALLPSVGRPVRFAANALNTTGTSESLFGGELDSFGGRIPAGEMAQKVAEGTGNIITDLKTGAPVQKIASDAVDPLSGALSLFGVKGANQARKSLLGVLTLARNGNTYVRDDGSRVMMSEIPNGGNKNPWNWVKGVTMGKSTLSDYGRPESPVNNLLDDLLFKNKSEKQTTTPFELATTNAVLAVPAQIKNGNGDMIALSRDEQNRAKEIMGEMVGQYASDNKGMAQANADALDYYRKELAELAVGFASAENGKDFAYSDKAAKLWNMLETGVQIGDVYGMDTAIKKYEKEQKEKGESTAIADKREMLMDTAMTAAQKRRYDELYLAKGATYVDYNSRDSFDRTVTAEAAKNYEYEQLAEGTGISGAEMKKHLETISGISGWGADGEKDKFQGVINYISQLDIPVSAKNALADNAGGSNYAKLDFTSEDTLTRSRWSDTVDVKYQIAQLYVPNITIQQYQAVDDTYEKGQKKPERVKKIMALGFSQKEAEDLYSIAQGNKLYKDNKEKFAKKDAD